MSQQPSFSSCQPPFAAFAAFWMLALLPIFPALPCSALQRLVIGSWMADSPPDAFWSLREGLLDGCSFCLPCERLSPSLRLRLGMLFRCGDSCELSWKGARCTIRGLKTNRRLHRCLGGPLREHLPSESNPILFSTILTSISLWSVVNANRP